MKKLFFWKIEIEIFEKNEKLKFQKLLKKILKKIESEF